MGQPGSLVEVQGLPARALRIWLSLVPFNEQDYLSKVQPELTYEYYENQVASYLAANMPSVSLADVAYDGPIHPQVFTALPTSLPYTVVGTTTTAAQVPDVIMYRVGLTLEQGETTLFHQVRGAAADQPGAGDDRLCFGRQRAAHTRLLLDGNVVATGPAVAERGTVTLVLDHYDPGSTGVSESFTYNRLAGQYLAVGLDAGQFGDRLPRRGSSRMSTPRRSPRTGRARRSRPKTRSAPSWPWRSAPTSTTATRPTRSSTA